MLKRKWDEIWMNCSFIKKLGLSCAAYFTVILDEIEHETGEVTITMKEFKDILGISNSMQSKHRGKLEDLGLVKVVRKGLPAKLHFIIDYQCFVNISRIFETGSL